MNILILTPDSVGSTLLQRVLTIYMQFHQFDKPVINLHELTNGLTKYYSPEFNRELLGKKQWGYYQTLPEIVDLLRSVDHYKTVRVAQYHINGRNDSISDQIPFYQYLNENFYIISCRRENLFEHALGRAITGITRKLNVFSHGEKINTFADLFCSKITIDPDILLMHCKSYVDYLAWCDQYFLVSNYFTYEQDVPNIERYLLDLPVFAGQPKKITWGDTYGQEFSDWNRCHYLSSDIGTLALSNNRQPLQLTYEPTEAVQQLIEHLPAAHQKFYATHRVKYYQAQDSMMLMEKLGILPSGIPIKKQTMREKQYLVRNFDQCAEVFNEWIKIHYPNGTPVDSSYLKLCVDREHQQWSPTTIVPAIANSLTPP